jgi:hypothetical protein
MACMLHVLVLLVKATLSQIKNQDVIIIFIIKIIMLGNYMYELELYYKYIYAYL